MWSLNSFYNGSRNCEFVSSGSYCVMNYFIYIVYVFSLPQICLNILKHLDKLVCWYTYTVNMCYSLLFLFLFIYTFSVHIYFSVSSFSLNCVIHGALRTSSAKYLSLWLIMWKWRWDAVEACFHINHKQAYKHHDISSKRIQCFMWFKERNLLPKPLNYSSAFVRIIWRDLTAFIYEHFFDKVGCLRPPFW